MVMRWIVLTLAMLSAAANAKVEAELPRSTVPISDSFRVTYTVDRQVPTPDFSPLQADFEVLSTAQSTNVSIVNGQMQQSVSWTIDLMARREGELTIPPLDFGGERSEALRVTVTAGDTGAGSAADREIYIEVEAEPAAPYVQGQVRFTLRIFRAVPTSDAALSEPQILEGDGVIERIGEDLVYETSRGGARFSVVERRYAIFPQSSGRLVVGPMTFEAVTGGQRSLFDPRPRGRRVRVRSEAMEFDVQPIPESFTGRAWLPAERVELIEDWPGQAGAQWRVGEPLTRTLTLRARGLSASQLAEIGAEVPEGLKQYADQPELDQATVDGSLVAVRRETVALIPSRAGSFELPAIEIPWWNTARDQLQYARVPARTVTVLPAAAMPDPAVTAAPVTDPLEQPPADGIEAAPVSTDTPTFLAWLSAVLAAGWLTTLALWFRSRRLQIADPSSPRARQRPPGPKAVIRELERACAANDPDAASQALLQWGGSKWPGNPVHSLGELAARLDGEMQSELHRLSRARYSRSGERWNGAALWQAFEANRRKRTQHRRRDTPQLEPLYR